MGAAVEIGDGATAVGAEADGCGVTGDEAMGGAASDWGGGGVEVAISDRFSRSTEMASSSAIASVSSTADGSVEKGTVNNNACRPSAAQVSGWYNTFFNVPG